MSNVSPIRRRVKADPPHPELLEIIRAIRWSWAPAHKEVFPRREWPVFVSVVTVPMLYFVIQSSSEKLGGRPREAAAAETDAASIT